MTNPAAAMKVLITYAICIPVAIFVGYLLANPLSYGSLGILGLVVVLVLSPVFIKWHYPIMVFALGAPIVCFFLLGRPPLGQVMVILSLGIAIVERAMNSDRRFIKVSAITWPLLFLIGVVVLTMELTGGLQLNTVSGGGGGGKKYIVLFIGVATYFALTSRPIPAASRRLYVALYFLSGLLAFLGDLFPYLPWPWFYINLLIPPTSGINPNVQVVVVRLTAFAASAGVLATFMLARYGLRGIFMGGKLWRTPVFLAMLSLSLLGGFRNVFASFALLLTVLFFLEGLHRTRMLMVGLFGGILLAALLVPFSDQLPRPFQRAISFLPVRIDPAVRMDAEGSSEWRYRIWRDTWPQVPQYLVRGKGYGLTAEDFQSMQGGMLASSIASILDASQESLAVSGDYHSGPLSTLVPFGAWGGVAMLWLMGACLWVHHRNFKYSSPELKIVNTLLFAACMIQVVFFLFVVGAFSNDVGDFAKRVGFCIALNGGVLGPKRAAATVPQPFKTLPSAQAA